MYAYTEPAPDVEGGPLLTNRGSKKVSKAPAPMGKAKANLRNAAIKLEKAPYISGIDLG